MRKLIVLLLSVFIFACSMNVSSFDEQVKPDKVEGAIKVAVLPLEKLDNQSGYIKKIMEVRDLQLLFDLSEKFILMDIESTNKVLEDFGDIAVDELDKEEILEIGQELGADVVITATIEELRNPQFNFIFNLFSMRTGRYTPCPGFSFSSFPYVSILSSLEYELLRPLKSAGYRPDIPQSGRTGRPGPLLWQGALPGR